MWKLWVGRLWLGLLGCGSWRDILSYKFLFSLHLVCLMIDILISKDILFSAS